MKRMNKKGQLFPYFVGGFVILFVIAFIIMLVRMSDNETGSFLGGGNGATAAVTGVPVESLSVLATNKHTKATEGDDDAEFWDLNADVTDTKLSARETLDLSSGSVTDTSVPALRSTDTPSTIDLWLEGAGNYYDDKIESWSIDYNEETGKGVLTADGPSGSIVMTDVGTIVDMDAGISAVSNAIAHVDDSDGTVSFNATYGSATSNTTYIRIELGNSEVDSELHDAVFCIGDADGDLEGTELSSMTISSYTGSSIGNMNSNILPLFSAAAGTGSTVCQDVGDIVGLVKGVYQIDFVWLSANWEANEEFEVGFDDLGDWKKRQYPSSNLKATAEDLVIDRTA